MSRLVTITVDLDELPAAISQSVVSVLDSHKLRIRDAAHVTLDQQTLALVLREIGKNCAQVVLFSDVDEQKESA